MSLNNKPTDMKVICNCNKLDCAICWDYSTYGFCDKCQCPLGVADFDFGDCPRCGNKEIKEGLQ